MKTHIRDLESYNKYIAGGENYLVPHDLEWRKGHVYVLVFKDLAKYCEGKKVLWIGCNNGTSIAVLSDYCKELVGLDINKDALLEAEKLIAQQNIRNITLVHSNALDMPFEDGEFDAIFAFDMIEHLFPEDFDKFTTEVARVLKKDGYFFIFTPKPQPTDHISKTHSHDSHHKIIWDTEEKIKDYLTRSGRLKVTYFTIESRSSPARPHEHNESYFAHLQVVKND